jgi:hypothetical protein
MMMFISTNIRRDGVMSETAVGRLMAVHIPNVDSD